MKYLLAGLLGYAVYAHIRFLMATDKPSPSAQLRPDAPCAFSSNASWLAIKHADPADVFRLLELTEPERSNWKHGFDTVYDPFKGRQRIYISPQVEGWTFVVGLALPTPTQPVGAVRAQRILEGLSGLFEEARMFLLLQDLEHYAWARASHGTVTRAFSFADEGVIWNIGKMSRDEFDIGLRLRHRRASTPDDELNLDVVSQPAELLVYPKPEHVLKLASLWSMNPAGLDRQTLVTGELGLLATAPASWKNQTV